MDKGGLEQKLGQLWLEHVDDVLNHREGDSNKIVHAKLKQLNKSLLLTQLLEPDESAVACTPPQLAVLSADNNPKDPVQGLHAVPPDLEELRQAMIDRYGVQKKQQTPEQKCAGTNIFQRLYQVCDTYKSMVRIYQKEVDSLLQRFTIGLPRINVATLLQATNDLRATTAIAREVAAQRPEPDLDALRADIERLHACSAELRSKANSLEHRCKEYGPVAPTTRRDVGTQTSASPSAVQKVAALVQRLEDGLRQASVHVDRRCQMLGERVLGVQRVASSRLTVAQFDLQQQAEALRARLDDLRLQSDARDRESDGARASAALVWEQTERDLIALCQNGHIKDAMLKDHELQGMIQGLLIRSTKLSRPQHAGSALPSADRLERVIGAISGHCSRQADVIAAVTRQSMEYYAGTVVPKRLVPRDADLQQIWSEWLEFYILNHETPQLPQLDGDRGSVFPERLYLTDTIEHKLEKVLFDCLVMRQVLREREASGKGEGPRVCL